MSICLICLQLYRSDRKDQASYEKYLSSSVSIQLKNDVVEVWKKIVKFGRPKIKNTLSAVYGNMFNILSIIQNREKWPTRNGKSFSNYEKTHHTKIFCISVTYVHLLFTYFIIDILKYKIYLMICCTEMSNIFLTILANLQFHEIFGTKN